MRTVYRSQDEAVDITAYVGPERDDGGMRRRYQVTVISDEDGRHHSASLPYEEWLKLKAAVREAS